MRRPSDRMCPKGIIVERRLPAADPLDGNSPLADWTFVKGMTASAIPIDDVKERQVLGTIGTPITYRVRVRAEGSVIREGDRITLSEVARKLMVAHIRNTSTLNEFFVFDCYDEPI